MGLQLLSLTQILKIDCVLIIHNFVDNESLADFSQKGQFSGKIQLFVIMLSNSVTVSDLLISEVPKTQRESTTHCCANFIERISSYIKLKHRSPLKTSIGLCRWKNLNNESFLMAF